MRYLILSDVHGGADEIRKALSYFTVFKADVIVLLGDLLNHGPRNRLPKSYEPPIVASLLNEYSDRIIAIRGNCDSEVDSMVFSFPCNAPYGIIYQQKDKLLSKIFLTHGHLYDFMDEKCIKKMGLVKGDLILSGHTHISGIFNCAQGVINFNPGSTTLPKGTSDKSFAFMDEDCVTLYDLDGNVIDAYELCYKKSN